MTYMPAGSGRAATGAAAGSGTQMKETAVTEYGIRYTWDDGTHNTVAVDSYTHAVEAVQRHNQSYYPGDVEIVQRVNGGWQAA